MQERVFVLIKPDAFRLNLTPIIINEILKAGFRISQKKALWLSAVEVDYIYKDVINENFYIDLRRFIMSGPCLALIIHGIDAHNMINQLKYYIRKKYSPNKIRLKGDELELWKINQHPRQSFYNIKLSAENLLHICDSQKESANCVSRFF